MCSTGLIPLTVGPPTSFVSDYGQSVGLLPLPSPYDPFPLPIPAIIDSLADADGERVGHRRGSVTKLAIANYVKAGMGVLTGPITARALGPVGRGSVAAVSVYDSVTTMLFSFGLPQAAGYFAVKKRYLRQQIMGAVFRISLLLLPVVAVTAYAVVYGPLAKFGTPVRVSAAVLVFLSPVSALGLTGRQFLLADGDLTFICIDDLMPILVNAAIVIPLGLVGALTVPIAVVAIILGNALAVLYAYVKAGIRPKGTSPYRPMLSFGSRTMFGSLANFVNSSLDQALVAPLLGVRALGLYAVAVSVAGIPLGLPSAFANRAFGTVGSAPDPEATAQAAEASLRVTILTTAALTALLFVASPMVVPLVYGSAFHHAVPSTLILLLGAVPFGVFLTGSQCTQVMGVPQYSSMASVIGLIVTLACLPLAIPIWGISGAAWVSTTAYSIRAGVIIVLLRRQGVRHLLPRSADAIAVSSQIRSKLTRLHGRRRESA